MLVKYAISYLQSKIQLGENPAPDHSDPLAPQREKFVSKPRPKDIGYFKEAITALQQLPPDAPLSEITPILHRGHTENLNQSTYYNSFIQPLDELLIAEQKRLLREEQERVRKAQQEAIQIESIRSEQESTDGEGLDRERLEMTRSTGNSSSIVDTAKQRDYASDLNTLRSKLHVKVQPKLDQLIKGLDKLSDEQAEEQAKILENTYNLLTDNMTVQEYQDFAKTVQGKPSPMLKAIGGLMIALAAAVVAFALVIPTAGLSLEVAGYTAVALAGPGAFSMFAGRQKGVSRDMQELANTHVAQLGN